jgi:tripartite-type tricarboxylate transporter receptor subunit TctC
MQIAQPEPPADLAVRVEFLWHTDFRIWLKENKEFLYSAQTLLWAIASAGLSAMMESSMRARAFSAAIMIAIGLGSADVAFGQSYPSRPITLVVPYAAGGPADAIARIVAERMRVSLGQPLIIENVSGAGGSLGTGRVAHAAGDGYTIMIGNWSTHVANGVLYSLPYDLQKDFEPVSLLATELDLIVARKDLPANSLGELMVWLKANAGKASAGTSGVGGPSHVAGLLFQKEIGVHFPLVPYRGAGPAVHDLLAGRIEIMITGPSVVLPHVRAGAIKAYAVTAKKRLETMPDIPTTDEAGLPGFYVAVWQGLWAPKGTAPDVLAKLAAATQETLADPAVRKRLADLALEVPAAEQRGPAALQAYQAAEIDKWWPVISAANIKVE